MRFVVTLIVALVLTLGPSSGQASAVVGYDSEYAGESAFLNIAPGPSQPFQVFFKNTGTATWQKNTASQVNLAICRADKTTCNVFSPNAEWNDGTWLSSIAYATTSQDVVMPGELGTFVYQIKAPLTVPSGTYRFSGDLVLARTLQSIHPQGYYQEATVAGP